MGHYLKWIDSVHNNLQKFHFLNEFLEFLFVYDKFDIHKVNKLFHF